MAKADNAGRPLFLYGLGWERSSPNRILPTFSRNYYRIHFITEGKGYRQTQTETVCIAKGLGFIIFPGEVPGYYPDTESPWEYFWIALEGTEIARIIDSCHLTRKDPVFRSMIPVDDMRRLLADMCISPIMPGFRNAPFIDYLSHFFSDVVQYNKEVLSNSLYFEKCIKYIGYHYAEHLTITDISEKISVDRTYLYKLFKKNLGISPHEYLTDFRISKACEILRTTKNSISDISSAVGYSDFSDFSRQFRRVKKMSPREYRQNNFFG